jgi:hypothetical protein
MHLLTMKTTTGGVGFERSVRELTMSFFEDNYGERVTEYMVAPRKHNRSTFWRDVTEKLGR